MKITEKNYAITIKLRRKLRQNYRDMLHLQTTKAIGKTIKKNTYRQKAQDKPHELTPVMPAVNTLHDTPTTKTEKGIHKDGYSKKGHDNKPDIY